RLRPAAELLLAFGSLIWAGVPAGCGSSRVPSVPLAKRFQGVTVNVACPSETAATLVQRYGQIWASQTGARIKAVAYDLAAKPGVESAADLWILSPARMPYWANSGKLWRVPEELVEHNRNYAWQNVLPLYRYKLCVWDQRVYALPLLGDALICFYRE